MSIRSLRVADIRALCGVLARAYASSQNFELRLNRYLRMRAVATFVAERNGEPIGMVVGNDYGSTAYVSQMAVDPNHQRRGIGSALMDALMAWAAQRNFDAVELDATPSGAPVYSPHGFIESGTTVVYQLAASPTNSPDAQLHTAPLLASDDRTVLRRYVARDREGVLGLDAWAFGADRRDVLGPLLEDSGNAVFLSERAGAIDGFAIAQARVDLLGPVVAENATVAARLFSTARNQLAPTHRVNVPSDCAAAHEYLNAAGYDDVRSLVHMVRGVRPPTPSAALYARINLGQG